MNKMYSITIFISQTADGQTCKSKITVPCKFNFKNNLALISYDEIVENKKFSSNVQIYGTGKITISRKGTQSYKFLFEKNKRHICTYFTEFGNIKIGVFTHEVSCCFEKNSCKIVLIYSLDTNNTHLSKNKVIINVKEDNYV